MRIQFKIDGGVAYMPGLAKPITIDTDQLTADEADEVRRLVASAGFFDGAAPVPPSRAKGADYQQYTITIEEGGRTNTVRLSDPVADPQWQALIGFLKAKAKALRRPKS
jgi:hypothetical protein